MVWTTTDHLHPGQEIVWSYGRRSSAELLVTYGFVLPNSADDKVELQGVDFQELALAWARSLTPSSLTSWPSLLQATLASSSSSKSSCVTSTSSSFSSLSAWLHTAGHIGENERIKRVVIGSSPLFQLYPNGIEHRTARALRIAVLRDEQFSSFHISRILSGNAVDAKNEFDMIQFCWLMCHNKQLFEHTPSNNSNSRALTLMQLYLGEEQRTIQKFCALVERAYGTLSKH